MPNIRRDTVNEDLWQLRWPKGYFVYY
jgi:hypothetical protein